MVSEILAAIAGVSRNGGCNWQKLSQAKGKAEAAFQLSSPLGGAHEGLDESGKKRWQGEQRHRLSRSWSCRSQERKAEVRLTGCGAASARAEQDFHSLERKYTSREAFLRVG
jgi:hypothetical protein